MGTKKFKITPAHTKFVEHFCLHSNATQAYLYAYPKVTYKSASQLGSLLLVNLEIQELIAINKEKLAMKFNISKETLISDLLDIKNDQKKADTRSAIQAIKTIGELLGFFQQKIDITSKDEKIKINLNLGLDPTPEPDEPNN